MRNIDFAAVASAALTAIAILCATALAVLVIFKVIDQTKVPIITMVIGGLLALANVSPGGRTPANPPQNPPQT